MMILSRCFLALFCVAVTGPAVAQDSINYPTLGSITVFDKNLLPNVLDPNAKIEVITSGYEWSEGPVWGENDEGGYLLFSDIPNNRIMIWRKGVGAKLFMKPSGYTGVVDYGAEPGSNGLVFDPEGQLVCCEHGDRRVSVVTQNGGKRTLVDNYRGKRLNSPNDAVYHSGGDLYFTDPPYGLPNRFDDPRRELDFCGVYRLGTDGELTLLTKELDRPNGLAFSPDEKFLYVAQSDPKAAIWTRFPVKSDGTLGPGAKIADATSLVGQLPGLPDGLKVSREGYLFATGPGGVHIMTPTGEPIGRINTGERTSNVAWGEDGSTLFITADTYVLRVRTNTVGANWKSSSKTDR